MSETGSVPGKAGPEVSAAVEEVRGIFPSNSALQDAVSRLGVAGFDRADISIPGVAPLTQEATPEQGAENPNTEEDSQQTRTLHSSMAGAVGALAAAGAVIATGGAAAPAVAAAVAGGVGLGAAAEGATKVADTMQHQQREEAAARGELVLSVRLRQPDRRDAAEAAMREAGATRVEGVVRTGVSASGWTG